MHGGDIYRHRIRLDYSVNVNPMGLPAGAGKVFEDLLVRCRAYPDLISERLRTAIAEMEGCQASSIICGNGASELFASIVHALKPKKALVLAPGFSGYEKALHMAEDCAVRRIFLKEEKAFIPDSETLSELDADADLLFLASPNNPTGQVVPEKVLKEILDNCRKNGTTVVLDECFEPFIRDYESKFRSLSLTEEYPNLISVRAFTKIFAMPGIRLGYLICSNEKVREEIAVQLPEWNVSLPAQLIGEECAKRALPFMRSSAAFIKEERAYLAGVLEECGFQVYPGQANFILFRTKLPLYDLLLEEGILIRDCSDYSGLPDGCFRIAVRIHEENEALAEALRKVTAHA